VTLAGSQNGSAEHPAVDTADFAAASVLNGSGAGYVNGTASIESSLRGAVSEILASTVANRPDSAEIGGPAEIKIIEPPLPSAPPTRSPSQVEQSQQPQHAEPQAGSAPLPEHPAAGSMFTPYLVT